MLTEFGRVLIFLIVGFVFVALGLVTAWLLRPNRPYPSKLTTYEIEERISVTTVQELICMLLELILWVHLTPQELLMVSMVETTIIVQLVELAWHHLRFVELLLVWRVVERDLPKMIC